MHKKKNVCRMLSWFCTAALCTTTALATAAPQSMSVQAGPFGGIAAFLYLHPVEIVSWVAGTFLALLLVFLTMLHAHKKSGERLQKALYTDPLTGHLNYPALCRDATKLVSQSDDDYALIYMDIHRFKVINDTYGYDTGDKVLIATSDALRAFLKDGERMARVHADIFVLLLRYSTQLALHERLDQLSASLTHISVEGSDMIKMLFRGGVYPLPQDFDDLDKACDRANYAKDSIVRHFSNTFVFYDDVMHGNVLAEKELENSMTGALERGEFCPFYQPKVNAITEKVVGAEALVRWNHPNKGYLSPGEFLPFYEKNGFIVKIDLCIFEQVCYDIRQWLQAGNLAVPVSVNFSRRHLQNKRLPEKLKEIADRYQVSTQLLEVEITETEELEDVEIAISFVDALKSYGFGVSIDDYGTGYSSISFLQQLPLDALKLDRKFIINATKTAKARDIMRHLVASMQKNGIRILCEGVETKEQRDFVISLNCRIIQGYLYSPPLPRTEFEVYLRRYGADSSDNLDFIPITNFEKNRWNGAEDFLTSAMPSWMISCFVAVGYPVHYISTGFLEGLGYSELEFSVATDGMYANLIHPDDLPLIMARLQLHKKQTQDMSMQYRLRKKDGIYLWIREVNKRILTDDGHEVLLGVCTDVTDIVTLQLEKSRLLETIPAGVGELLLTEHGPVIKHAADRFYGVIAYSPDEMAARENNIFRIMYEQDVPSVLNNLREVAQTQTPFCECTFRIRRKDDSLHWVTFRGTIFHSAKNSQATVLVYDSDEEMQAKQSAETNRVKLELALSLTGQAVFEYDISTKTIYSHSGFAAYGISDKMTLDVPNGLLASGFVHPKDLEKMLEIDRQICSGIERVSCEFRVHGKLSEADSPYIWVRLTLSTICNEDGLPVRAVGSVENINQQKRFEDALLHEAQYRKAFTESSLMAYELNLTQNKIQRVTGSRGFRLRELLEIDNSDQYSVMLAVVARVLVAPDDRESVVTGLSRESLLELYKNGVFEKVLEYRRKTLDGLCLWTEVLVYLLLDQLSGDVMGYAYHRDIQERKEAEMDLADQAARDPLTGVLNRATAEQQIQDYLSGQTDSKQTHAFLMLDLDRFKAVNDTYGHHAGDKYLIKVTNILSKHVREQDIVARMGGDEFAVLLKEIPNETAALTIAKKLVDSVRGIGKELGIALPTSVSIGVAVAPLHGTDFDSLYRLSDDAMYQAKQSTERVVLYGALPVSC